MAPGVVKDCVGRGIATGRNSECERSPVDFCCGYRSRQSYKQGVSARIRRKRSTCVHQLVTPGDLEVVIEKLCFAGGKCVGKSQGTGEGSHASRKCAHHGFLADGCVRSCYKNNSVG